MAARKRKVRGFRNVQATIARKDGVSMARAGRILGAATKRNPTLRKRAAAGRRRAARRRSH